MKKLFCMLLVFALLLPQLITASAVNDGGQLLSEMSDEELIAFVKSYDITIPDDYEEEWWADFIRETVEIVEAYPNYRFDYNYSKTRNFANAIQIAANAYYGVTSTQGISTYAVTATLQYSVAYTAWNDLYDEYNCYCYALGLPSTQYDFYDPGDFAEVGFSINKSISNIAGIVKQDLLSDNLGYNCVKTTTTCPAYSSVRSGQTVIAVRKRSDDFHFMRLNTDEWIHKPGASRPLLYLYEAEEFSFWSKEAMYETAVYGDNVNKRYVGDVYFIIFQGDHNPSGNGTRINYHSGVYHYDGYRYTCGSCSEVYEVCTKVFCDPDECEGNIIYP